jgi:hypothetical protein
MTLAPGTRLGPYEILSPLGAGGMGEVWKAKDTRLDRCVAVKVLPEHLAKSPEALARFEREAKAVAALNHPNITGIFDIGNTDGTAYVAMELLEGESLRTRLESGPLTPKKATELAIQLAQGLAAAHEKGVVHRDLKPDNLWITREGRLKILDFGLAKQIPTMGTNSDSLQPTAVISPGHHTGKGMLLGTLGYMSPEQVRGESVDARSDIFSFGAVLFEILTGKKAFARGTASDTMAAILRDEPPEIADSGRPMPPALRRILDHCLEKAPGGRFHDAQDLAFALESVLGSASGSGAESAALIPGPKKIRSAWWAALGLGLVVGVASWWLFRPTLPRPRFTQATFRRGNVLRARFTPDGQNMVYSAAWDGRPCEIFLSRLDGSGVRAVGLPGADLMAVNGRGELLILLKSSQWTASSSSPGTLAMASLDGGTPRELLARVKGADFAPDGQALAVIYQDQDGGPFHLDFPLGTHLVASLDGDPRAPRISPQGDLVAFIYYTSLRADEISSEGSIAVVDRAGKQRVLKTGLEIADEYLAWSRDGRELYFCGKSGVMSVDLGGRVRLVNAESTTPLIHDVSAQGLMLLEREIFTNSALVCSEGRILDLGWQSNSSLEGFSRDGSLTLLFEAGGGPSNQNRPFLRRLDASPPKVLDPGFPLDLSQAGDLALVVTPGENRRLRIVPTGLGPSRELALEGWFVASARFSVDGKQVFVIARQGNGPIRIHKLPIDGGRGVMLPESVQNLQAISPDGKRLLCLDGKGQPFLTSEAGGLPLPLAWTLAPGESIVAWTSADEVLVTHPEDAAHLRVERVKLATGRRTLWQRLAAPDPVTTIRMQKVRVSGDGETVGYTCSRVLVSDLIVAEGLK